ncbi:hypothetical protein B0H14DRAFT_3024339, partial [Mycena olivaceomarginata]
VLSIALLLLFVSLYALLFASAASSGMCFQIHGVVTWVVAILRLVYVVDPPGGFDSL